MTVKPEQFFELTLIPGAVYKFADSSLINSEIPHFFILLNNNPKSDHVLLLLCSTSQIKKARERAIKRGFLPDTIVEISKDDYEDFTLNSLVDCNSVFPVNKEMLLNKYTNGKLEIKKELSPGYLQKLQNAFLKSKKHAPSIKRIIDNKQ